MTYRRMLILGTAVLAFMLSAYAGDVAGKWTAAIDTPMGTQNTSFEFKVDGDKLTGSVSNDMMGAAEIKEGKVTGTDISFVEIRTFGDNEFRLAYKGKITGDDEIKFTRTVGDFGSSDFVAKRAK